MPAVVTRVTSDPLDAAAHDSAVAGPDAGAVVAFHGVIRDHDPEAEGVVTGIDYTAHPDAQTVLEGLVADVLARLDPDGAARVAVSHRIGHLDVGELALVCCVASAHRAAAFALCAEVVEVIKAGLPIWKHQTEESGRRVWSNLGVEGV
ncbi:MAG: molybdenum cofactor biosynthesis protein MoaE [Propionibacteriaceae bacterium]|nr:molybdenum cofactor biosynthesis protein MoaE [Propionibacteriaceae bacterium]